MEFSQPEPIARPFSTICRSPSDGCTLPENSRGGRSATATTPPRDWGLALADLASRMQAALATLKKSGNSKTYLYDMPWYVIIGPPGSGKTTVGRAILRLIEPTSGAVVFDGAHIEAGAVVERSIIGFGAHIGPRALIRDGVIGDGADIGARCELLRGARVWPGVFIPDCGIRYSSDV